MIYGYWFITVLGIELGRAAATIIVTVGVASLVALAGSSRGRL